jgi:hypothetical protein
MQKDGSTRIKSEEITLRQSKTSPSLKGKIAGEVTVDGTKRLRTWAFAGFRRDEEISLSFATVPGPKDPNPTGIGSYYLRKASGSGFTGVAIYKDVCLAAFVRCPYVMTEDDIDINEAKRRFPIMMEQQCVKMDLIPDAPREVAQTGCRPSSN